MSTSKTLSPATARTTATTGATERFRPFSYDELLQRDKVSLDLIWLRDESLEGSDNLPAPDVLAQEIAEDLEAALSAFAQIAESLRARAS
jgi:type I restriction enzyme M protein